MSGSSRSERSTGGNNRLSRAGLVALMAVGVALTLFGCGGDGGGEREATLSASSKQADRRPPRPARGGCGADLTRFTRSLDGLRDQLAVGLTYDQYLENVERLQGSYRQIHIGDEPARCVVGAGVPAERALNQ